jgi:hypothetical protein
MRVTLTAFLPLGEVMQAPGGPGEAPGSGFGEGGWLVPCADQNMERLVADWCSGGGSSSAARKLADIKSTSTGVVTRVCESARKPAYGSFTPQEPHRERDQRTRQAAARGSGGER